MSKFQYLLLVMLVLCASAIIYLVGFNDGMNEGERVTLKYNSACQPTPVQQASDYNERHFPSPTPSPEPTPDCNDDDSCIIHKDRMH